VEVKLEMDKLKRIILDNEEILIDKILKYAKDRNYVKYSSTLRDAWRMSIAGISAAFIKVIEKSNSIPEMGPDDDFTKDEVAEFGILEAQKHRSRGVTLGMYLGLIKYYQQVYIDLINESNFSSKEKKFFSQYIKRYFDHIELGFTVEWAGLSEKQKLEDLQKANRELTNEKNKYLTIFESIYDPIIIVDKDNNIENINNKAAEVFLDVVDLGMKYYGNINTDKDLLWLNEELIRFIDLNKNEVFQEKTIETKTGKKTFLIKFKKNLDVSEKYKGSVIIFNDITERKRLEIALSNEKKLLETTLISVGDGVISTNNKGNIVFLNRVAEFLTGWTQEAAMGKSIIEVFNIVNAFTREKSENIVKKVLESGRLLELADNTILISKDGIERFLENSGAPIIQENGEIVGVVLVFRDFSEKKHKQEKIEFLSYHDQLTGLYNRRFYEEELKRLDTERNLPMSIVMGDVNGLKLANDSFGHAFGDEILKKVADVMRAGCHDYGIVARFGGDEFVIILPKTDNLLAEQIIKRINDLLLNEIFGSIDISVSFGYETKNNGEEKVQDILKKAEDNMYNRKLFESPRIRTNTISGIISTLHEKNKREEEHSNRVSELCKSMGEALGLPKNKIEELKAVGLLHDIGKIAIDENILNKSGKLTIEEWKEIKRHPEIGYRILSTVNDMSKMAKDVLHHHERWDGKGYPSGLKEENIPFVSRIISIVDAYDAMTSERSYRSALPERVVLEELQNNAGSQFDPELINVFIKKILIEEC